LAKQILPEKKLWFGSKRMPTVFWKGPYRFFFYVGDRNEPAHIHVEHENRVAKFWLDPVMLQSSAVLAERKWVAS